MQTSVMTTRIDWGVRRHIGGFSQGFQRIHMRLDSFTGDGVLDVIERRIVATKVGVPSVAMIDVLRSMRHNRVMRRRVDVDLRGIGQQTRPESPRRKRKNQLTEMHVRGSEIKERYGAYLLRRRQPRQIVQKCTGIVRSRKLRPPRKSRKNKKKKVHLVR